MLRNTTFVAIDFETANYSRDSACAVALVRAEAGKIVAQDYSLIRPPVLDFVFTHIHGITADQVAQEPDFAEVWQSMQDMVRGIDFFVAHNAGFDKGVLHACCRSAGITLPTTPFACTVKLAKKQLDLDSNALPSVCQHLHIALNHHNALSDAQACAAIALALSD